MSFESATDNFEPSGHAPE